MTKEEWRKANLAKMAAYQRKWTASNPEKVKKLNRERYLARRDERLEKRKIYADQNKDAIKSYQKLYATSPEGRAIRLNAEYRRRARMKGQGSDLTNAQIKELFSAAAKCSYCGCCFCDVVKPTLDHIIPLSKGGLHALENLTIACGLCNSKKGSKLDYMGAAPC